MTALIQRMNTIKKSDFSAFTFVNDSFWNLLLLSSLMFAILVGLQRLF